MRRGPLSILLILAMVTIVVVVCIVYMLTSMLQSHYDYPNYQSKILGRESLPHPPTPQPVFNTSVMMLSCINQSVSQFQQWKPSMMLTWTVISNVQTNPNELMGFLSRCDWVIGSHPVHWRKAPNNTAWGNVRLNCCPA